LEGRGRTPDATAKTLKDVTSQAKIDGSLD
jgi:hypothetical protein